MATLSRGNDNTEQTAEQTGTGLGVKWLLAIVAVAVAALAVSTRVPGALTYPNTIDEAHHHLESWARAYGTDDAYPVFRRRLERGGLLPGRLAELEPFALRVYDAGPVAQRGLIVLTDPQPPLYPTLAELTQWVSGSSLLALRGWSVLFGVLAVWLAYRAGKSTRDETTGLWFAALLGGAALSQWYGGIGRPYAFAQAALLLAVWAFLHHARQPDEPKRWRRLLLAALFAQLAQWIVWPIVGVLLLGGLVAARRARVKWKPLLRPLGWYVPASVLLVGYLGVQLLNPTVSQQAGDSTWGQLLADVAVVSPFAHLGGVVGESIEPGLRLGGWLFLLLSAVGGVVMLLRPRFEQVVLLAASVVAAGIVVFVNSQWRFQLTLALLPMLLAAWALRILCVRPAVSAALSGVYAFTMLGVFWLSPLPRLEVMTTESRFDAAARALEAELGPSDRWSAYPYFLTSVLYRDAALPAPELLTTRAELEAWLDWDDDGGRRFLFTSDAWRASMPALPGATEAGRFVNGYVLLELD